MSKIDRQVFIQTCGGKVQKIDFNNVFCSEADTEKNQYMRKILKDIFVSYMTERQAEIATMFFADNMSATEIAEVSGVNKSTISRTLQRAKREINNNLGHYRAEFMHIAAADKALADFISEV